jgi:maltooligosyltrehalose trehalohydrolase
MKHQHLMPFGTQVLEDGRVSFRLWAPGSNKVTLCIEPGTSELLIPMERRPDGWFEVTTDAANPGSRYLFKVNDDMRVPDPASRFNPQDVHGPSEVIAPQSFPWVDTHWKGRPWEEAVVYELHVGTFTPEGTFKALKEKLDYFVELGVTAIELMPVADFPGARNWGYDGVLLYAPDSTYGRPDDLKDLIQTAHEKGLMVLLDVVYNHFGPDGNYLHVYAPQFFKEEHTPWGAAINYDREHSATVREFFIHNALFWLHEYRFDGLRLDAVHSILDHGERHILDELAERVHASIGQERHMHLVLENDLNQACFLERPGRYTAQWNDDFHHALHVLLTGEHDEDFSDKPMQHLIRCLSEGFAYQGENSVHRFGVRRGSPSAHLPASAFVPFLQNHDQIGNRAFGERITELVGPRPLRAGMAVMLLAPHTPLLFMGEEYGEKTRFTFFCDWPPEQAQLVRDGRRKEFADKYPEFNDPEAQKQIPDPSHPDTFLKCKLDWSSLERPEHQAWLAYYQDLLLLRKERVVPHLPGLQGSNTHVRMLDTRSAHIEWRLGDGTRLHLIVNLSSIPVLNVASPPAPLLFTSEGDVAPSLNAGTLPPWSVAWYLEEAHD